MEWFVYILRCEDDTLYTGIATDVQRRMEEHRSGRGAKYTRSHPPRELVWCERAEDHGAALRREAAVKRLSRAEKLKLIETLTKSVEEA